MSELGGDTLKAFTVIPSFGGYFKSVRGIAEYTPQRVELALKNYAVAVEGDDLEIAGYFEQDIFIKGGITNITVSEAPKKGKREGKR